MPSIPEALAAAVAREAEALVRRYDFSAETTVSPLSRSENTVFLVSDPGKSQKHVIRVNSGRLSYHTEPSIRSELLWLMAIARDTDIVVPGVLPAKDGSLVQTLSAPDLDRPRHAAFFTFLSGSEPPEDALIPGFERLGEISAKMHAHAKSWEPPAGFTRHRWSPEAILEDHYNWGSWRRAVAPGSAEEALFERLGETLSRRLSRLPRDRERFGLIHADLRLANLLVENGTTKVIDFDDCGFGWYGFDLASALSFIEARPDVPDLIAAWLKGYRKISSLQPEIEAEIMSFVLLRRIQILGWAAAKRDLEFVQSIWRELNQDSLHLAEDYLKTFG